MRHELHTYLCTEVVDGCWREASSTKSCQCKQPGVIPVPEHNHRQSLHMMTSLSISC